jgi:hypothetical protein
MYVILNVVKINTKAISRKGELLVFGILPKAEWLNIDKESFEHYDIIWEDIKIDVKTTMQPVASSTKAFQFYDFSSKKGSDVILVLVAIYGGKEMFWIESSKTGKLVFYKKERESLSKLELPDAIKKTVLAKLGGVKE